MKIWESFLDLLFPPKCPFCRNILDDPRAPVCPECQGKLPWLLGEDALRAVEGTARCAGTNSREIPAMGSPSGFSWLSAPRTA